MGMEMKEGVSPVVPSLSGLHITKAFSEPLW